MSVMSGFDRDLHEKILGFNPHIKVYSRSGEMRDYEKTAEQVRSVAHVRAVAPFAFGQVWMETQPNIGPSQGMAPYLRGIEADLESQVSVLSTSIIEGKFDVSGRGLLIGNVMANNLHLQVGDVVVLYSPSQLQKMKLSQEEGQPEAILADNYEIKGIFDVGFFEYNSSFLITSMLNFQELFDMDDTVQGLLVMLDDPQLVTPLAEELNSELGLGYYTSTWMQENSQIVSALVVEKNVMFYILFLIMVVAGFGIA
ncbi:MAG: hypothetical protein QM428_06215, partial [Verrucomicrobiota bacterium]|nr:hypothetical protein [Verrucomicrobiota bacterium]